VSVFRMPFSRPLSFARRAVVVLTVGAGVALSPLPAQASAPAGLPTAAAPAAAVAGSSAAAQVAVNKAMAQRGDPYVYGAAGPDAFDCSGLTKYAYAAAGKQLPHSSRAQAGVGRAVSRAHLRPGDLVFFYNPIGHVGMYIGNGQMVHAPKPGSVVKVINLDHMPGYATARRIA
jgi:cell wall-associated NlpC family hydrolase